MLNHNAICPVFRRICCSDETLDACANWEPQLDALRIARAERHTLRTNAYAHARSGNGDGDDGDVRAPLRAWAREQSERARGGECSGICGWERARAATFCRTQTLSVNRIMADAKEPLMLLRTAESLTVDDALGSLAAGAVPAPALFYLGAVQACSASHMLAPIF